MRRSPRLVWLCTARTSPYIREKYSSVFFYDCRHAACFRPDRLRLNGVDSLYPRSDGRIPHLARWTDQVPVRLLRPGLAPGCIGATLFPASTRLTQSGGIRWSHCDQSMLFCDGGNPFTSRTTLPGWKPSSFPAGAISASVRQSAVKWLVRESNPSCCAADCMSRRSLLPKATNLFGPSHKWAGFGWRSSPVMTDAVPPDF